MNANPDRLYDLLPVVYRQRDLARGEPLRMLLRVVAEQVNVVEEDIAELYDNLFIETCADWAVPYIGDLIGYRPVHEAGEPGDVTTPEERQLNKILVPRREVANTIRYRRRKGTLALLELLATAVTGCPARVVEFGRYLGIVQSISHLHLDRGRLVDVRSGNDLDLLGSPFDGLSHTVDVRRTDSHRSYGKHNLPSVGAFVWRLKPYSVTRTQAYCLEEVGDHCYTFSILGNNVPLYTKPVPEMEPTHIAGELNLPIPIRRRAFEQRPDARRSGRSQASDKYYGEGKSLAIWAGHWADGDPSQPIPREKVIPADLTDWKYRPRPGHVAVDPELGRIAFPPGHLPEKGVWVSYTYGFGADIGGGEYLRPVSVPPGRKIYCVGANAEFHHIHEAYARWAKEKPAPAHGIIEITDSGVYEEQIHIEVGKDQTLELRAASGARPVIFLLDWRANRPDALTVSGASGSRFYMDGLLVTGRGIEIKGHLDEVGIRHSTLVPGWALHSDCRPRRGSEPSLWLVNTCARIKVEHSILGSIRVIQEEPNADPMSMSISDSIVDATRREAAALSSPESPVAPVVLAMARCTVFGEIQTHAIALAEDCIFGGDITVARRQQGCMRFCYVPPGSRTPRRYNCQPDLVDQAVLSLARQEDLSSAERRALQQSERLRIEPQFNDMRYGTPQYARLADTCADEIMRGADDESEMGVFHDLFEPQRAANLRARLDEYNPAAMDIGIIYAS
jgi:hypothetical protein